MGKTYDDMAREVMRQYETDAYAYTCDAILQSHKTKIYPTAQQKGILDAISKPGAKVSVKSGHGTGKSSAESWAISWFVNVFPDCRVPVTAPSSHQLYDIVWGELHKWREGMVPFFKDQFIVTSDRAYIAGQQQNRYAAARTARRENPDALQGFHAPNLLFLIEEASGVDDSIFELAEGALSTPGCRMLMCANPTRLDGYFYRSHTTDRKYWNCITLNSEESPLCDKKFIERMKRYGTDSNTYKVRVRGEFPESSADNIIPLGLVESALDRDIQMPTSTPRIAGLDVARMGDDKTAIVVRQGGVITFIDQWEKRDIPYTIGRVMNIYRERKLFDSVNVDAIGMGAGVADQLATLHVPTLAINVSEATAYKEKYYKLRDELWGKAQEFYESRQCKIDTKQITENCVANSKEQQTQMGKELIGEFIGQITAVKYGFTPVGKFKAESKDEMKDRKLDSPNLADAHNLTFAEGQVQERSISGQKRDIKVVSMNKYV